MRFGILISILFFQLLSLSSAADEIFSYPVKNRSPEELTKIANSMFQGRANFIENQGKILISADAKTAKKAMELLQQLDQKLKTYRIQFRWKGMENNQRREGGVGLNAGGKKWKATLPNPVSSSGATAQVGGVSISANQVDRKGESGSNQSLLLTGAGEGTLSLSDFDSGSLLFVKLSTTSGSVVNLSIRQGNRSGVAINGMNTQMTIPLSKWTSIGQIRSTHQKDQTRIGGSTTNSGETAREMEVRVDEFNEG